MIIFAGRDGVLQTEYLNEELAAEKTLRRSRMAESRSPAFVR